jgi:hypothetical protein
LNVHRAELGDPTEARPSAAGIHIADAANERRRFLYAALPPPLRISSGVPANPRRPSPRASIEEYLVIRSSNLSPIGAALATVACLLAASACGGEPDPSEDGAVLDGKDDAQPGMGAPDDGAHESAPLVNGCSVFPANNAWNTDISGYAVHPNSTAFINSIGRWETLHADFGTEWAGGPMGIPYVSVPGTQPEVPIDFVAYGDESDPGPYPIPPDAPVEGGPGGDGDRHVLVVDHDNCMLYELFRGFPQGGGSSWEADSGAIWDLKINDTRPIGWTSADAAGLPIFPGLVRYDEAVTSGVIPHALRFTVAQSQKGFIAPATHYASNSTNSSRPPMGLRLRMKSSYNCNGYSQVVRVICTALKKYGMIVADNGSDWFVSGTHDSRWDDDALSDIGNIPGDAFQVVSTGSIQTHY